MERKEFIISDIVKAANCENLCSNYTVSDKWEIVNYETKEIKGRGILASCRTHPEKITINPNLKVEPIKIRISPLLTLSNNLCL